MGSESGQGKSNDRIARNAERGNHQGPKDSAASGASDPPVRMLQRLAPKCVNILESNSSGEILKPAKREHPISIVPYRGRVVVRYAGEVVADTTSALELREASYRPVIYVPRADTELQFYERSDHRTHCPYKGDASYFHLTTAGKRAENAVWSYETPLDGVKEIAGYVAFYPDKVSVAHA